MSQDIHSIIERLKELHEKAPGELRYWPTHYAGTTPYIIGPDETEREARIFVAQNAKSETRDTSLSVHEGDRAIAYAKYITETANALPALLEYVSHLEEALKPFATMSEHYTRHDEDTFHGLIHSDGTVTRLTYGDLRRAKHVLNGGE